MLKISFLFFYMDIKIPRILGIILLLQLKETIQKPNCSIFKTLQETKKTIFFKYCIRSKINVKIN